MRKLKEPLRSSPKVETRLASADIKRLDELAKEVGTSRSDLARQALLWYLANQEKLTLDSREAEVAKAIRDAANLIVKAINKGVDRICKMLARLGIAVGTMYELHWMAMPPGEEGEQLFEEARSKAKQQQRRLLEKDEAEIAAGLKRVAGAGE